MSTNKLSIPEVRKRLREIADETQNEELMLLADQMYRRAPKSVAAAESTPMSLELAEEIREYKRQYPKISQRKIGQHFNVNAGRVSEALAMRKWVPT